MNNPLFVRFIFNFSFGGILGIFLSKFFPEGVKDINWWIGLIIFNFLIILYRLVNNTLDEAINNKKNT